MVIKDLTREALAMVPEVLSLSPAVRKFNPGAIEDILNVNGCCYYQWLPKFLEVTKPKQIVELGGAMGAAVVMMMQSEYQDFNLYSITLPEGGLEFSFVADTYPNFHPALGDDLDLSNWPKELDLSLTDLWFFDSLHEEGQLRAELDLYSPFFKKGAIALFDDIHMHEGMERVWNDVLEGKWGITEAYDGTNPLHYSGFGVCRV